MGKIAARTCRGARLVIVGRVGVVRCRGRQLAHLGLHWDETGHDEPRAVNEADLCGPEERLEVLRLCTVGELKIRRWPLSGLTLPGVRDAFTLC